MPTLQIDGPAPYGPATTVVAVIEQYRQRGLPQPLTLDGLGRVGVSESLRPRVLATLKQLGLIDTDGMVTDDFEALRRAATPEFKPLLVDFIRSVYGEVFTVVDPAGATYQQVHDAFRQFTPVGQIDRMVALFLGLLEYAEYSDDLPSARPAGSGAGSGGSRGGGSAPAKKAAPTKKAAPGKPPTQRPDPAEPGRSAYSTTVTLGAGTVTLGVDVNPLLLVGEDREFFFGLVDKIEARRSQTPAGNPAGSGHAADEEVVS